jgi:hypothetical protein
MRRSAVLAALAAALVLAGCAGPGRYPLGRAAAGPDDPVLRMVVPPVPERLEL